MPNNFSLFEQRMIQGMITKYEIPVIADLVEKPVQEVENYINHFVAGKDIIPLQQRLEATQKDKKREKQWKILQKKKAVDERADIIARKNALKKIKRTREQEGNQKRKRTEPVFKTLIQDFSKMRSIRIDRKTIIFLKPGEDADLAKKNYLKNVKSSTLPVPVSKNVIIKKFKPIK